MALAESNSFPATSVAAARAALSAPGMPYETETLVIGGRRVRAYKHAPPHLRAVFEASARWGAREFLIFEDERLTYDAHYRAVAALARRLAGDFGLRKGDRLAIAMRNFPEWSIAFWAAAVCGAIIAPLNAWGTSDDLRHAIELVDAKVALVDAERLERLAPCGLDVRLISVRAPHRDAATSLEDLIGPASNYGAIADCSLPDVTLAPDDDATLFFTSGTTGRSKAALGTHRNIITNSVNVDFAASFRAARRGLPVPIFDATAPQLTSILPAPFFHVTGSHSTLVPAMIRGRRVVLMYKWSPERALELIEREKVNATTGVPSMTWQMLESPDFARRDLSSLQGVSFGGAPAAPELVRQAALKLPNIPARQAYGATETSSVVTSISAEDYLLRPASVGPAVPCCDIRIVKENGDDAAPDEAGEIWVSGPNVIKGYWNDPEATAAAFVDGWYRTGDIGRRDEEGFVFVMDRVKDMLIRGGENIYCVEIEDALMTHEAVLDAAIMGLPHRVLGEEVGAVVQVKGDISAGTLRAHLAGMLAAHKIPVLIDIRREELPKNASGKTLKRLLREELSRKREA